MKEEAKAFILSTVGVSSTQRYENYLGFPALIGRSKVSAFTEIKGRVWERINGWKEKIPVPSRNRNPSEGSDASYPNIYNECLSMAKNSLLRY
jgi:hypothetical protein